MKKTALEKIENLIIEANKIKFKLMEAQNNGNTVLSEEQANEIIRELRDQKLREILGDD
jgi:uncharacterized protein YbaP (TraB family)